MAGKPVAAARALLERAVRADPYAREAHSQLAEVNLEIWRTTLNPADYSAFERNDAMARNLAPQSAAAWRMSAERYQRAFAQTDGQGRRASHRRSNKPPSAPAAQSSYIPPAVPTTPPWLSSATWPATKPRIAAKHSPRLNSTTACRMPTRNSACLAAAAGVGGERALTTGLASKLQTGRRYGWHGRNRGPPRAACRWRTSRRSPLRRQVSPASTASSTPHRAAAPDRTSWSTLSMQ